VFSPIHSLTRILFEQEIPVWILVKPSMEADWSPCLHTLEGHSGYVRSVAFSHNSHLLASASDDGTVKLWDPATGQCLRTLKGHNSYVYSVAFSYDSHLLVSASNDGTINLWNPATGQCLQTLKGHKEYIRSVAFSYDSHCLASASDDSTIKLWDPGSVYRRSKGIIIV
jgi:WD40 repeat protein